MATRLASWACGYLGVKASYVAYVAARMRGAMGRIPGELDPYGSLERDMRALVRACRLRRDPAAAFVWALRHGKYERVQNPLSEAAGSSDEYWAEPRESAGLCLLGSVAEAWHEKEKRHSGSGVSSGL